MNSEVKLFAGAGKAKVLFTPDMFPTDGFCKVHDDPHIRVLLLHCGAPFVIVAAELVMVPKPFVAEIKKIITEQTGIPAENIWVHCNHTITTPHTPGPKGPPNKRPPMSEEDAKKRDIFIPAIMNAVRQATEQAVHSVKPAVLGFGSGLCDVNACCREQEISRGLRPAEKGPGVCDKTLSVLRFDGLDRDPIAFMLCYGMKPSTVDNAEMDSNTRQVTSDLPGKACAVMEEAFGVPALYCMAAAADQYPKEQAIYDAMGDDGKVVTVDHGVAYGLELVGKYGALMGGDAVAIARSIDCDQSAPVIKTAETSFDWESMPDPKKPTLPGQEMSTIPVKAMLLGDIAFVATSPEVNGVTGMQVKEASPFDTTLLVTMNDAPTKYMPDKTGFEDNTPEAQKAFAKPGAAEQFVTVAADLLKQLKK